MRGKALAQRRARNQELARIDAANRCAICKRALTGTSVQLFSRPERMCSPECVAEAEARVVAEKRDPDLWPKETR